MSLGAKRPQVVMLIVRQGMQFAGAGVLLGIAGAFVFKQLFAGLLVSLQGMALGALANAILLLALVTMLASLFTAFRIASIEPMMVLRNE